MRYLPTGRGLIDPFAALAEAGITQGMKVADLGVGTVGHFLFPASELVGKDGAVYGVDILKSVLESNESNARLQGKGENIHFVWGDIDRIGGTRIPDSSMDMVIVANLLHLGTDGGLLEEANRILHSGGILLVVDWKPAGTTFGPNPEKRIPLEKAKELLTKYGFETKKDFVAGKSHYGIVAMKPVART